MRAEAAKLQSVIQSHEVLISESSTAYTVIILKILWCRLSNLLPHFKTNLIIPKLGWHSGVAGSIAVSSLRSPQFDPEFGLLAMQTDMFFPCLCGFLPGSLISAH